MEGPGAGRELFIDRLLTSVATPCMESELSANGLSFGWANGDFGVES